MMRLFAEGDENRTTASTRMNTTSSRSHLILQIEVESYNKISRVTNRVRVTGFWLDFVSYEGIWREWEMQLAIALAGKRNLLKPAKQLILIN